MRRLLVVVALAACTQKPEPDPCTKDLRATPARLLTRFELDNTLRDLLADGTRPARAGLPAEPLALGLDNNTDVYTVTQPFQSQLLDVAEQAAARAVAGHFNELVPCAGRDLSCGAQFIEGFGRRAFRRPLSPDEQETFVQLFDATLTSEGFDAAVESTVTAVLMSPQFLYRLERFGAGDTAQGVDAHALASRLSYFLWGTMPDGELLAAASTGELVGPGGLETQTRRMLADPRAADPAAHFFALWLHTDALAGLEKDTTVYPAFTPGLRASWQRSIELFVGDTFSRTPTLGDVLTSSVLYVDDAMGGMYGNGPVAPGAGFMRVEMPAAQRTGLITQPGFLAQLSGPNQSSPVRRGVFVLEKVMCLSVPPPPPSVNAVPPKLDPSLTTRERYAVHGETRGCSGCHTLIDGIGFGFEHYDGIGAWRDTDNGKPVDATGEVTESNGAALDGPYDGARELLGRLSSSRQVTDCMASQWYRLALGRVETGGDQCSVTRAQDAFFEGGGDFAALRTAIVLSPAFRTHVKEAE